MMRARLVLVLVAFVKLGSVTACRSVVADRAAPPPKPASILAGMWVLVSRADGSEIPGAGSRLKIFTASHWFVTEAEYPGGRVTAHQGGSYTLAGDVLTTTTAYALPNMVSSVGGVRQFRITVEGDVYTQIGLGNPYSETWHRVKEPAQ